MDPMFFKKYIFGDTAVYYVESPVEGHENKTTIGFAVYPASVEVVPEKLHCDSLVQVAFVGDEALIDYTEGVTMRNRSSTVLRLIRQDHTENWITTQLADDDGNVFFHILSYDEKTHVFMTWVRYHNESGREQTLSRLDSISLSGIGAAATLSTEGLILHRMASAWSRECRMKSDTFAHLGLDMSWGRYGVKVEKWGQNGSMPNRGYFPFGAIEDEGRYCLGVMLSAPYSWNLEVYKEKETCALSGGLADYETGHWRKKIGADEAFETEIAYFTVREDVNDVCNAFVKFQDHRLDVRGNEEYFTALPASEESMPILFNEYCTTWGCPSEENITKILAAIEGLPIDYFVVDCGWYKPDDKGWCNAIGDWNESKALFPNGIKAVADKIRAAGKLPGVWFEFENVGRDSEAFYHEELLLKRDGNVITSKNRRFLDLRKPEVKAYLQSKMLDFLKDNGFQYIKIDYNDTFGIGCDGAESLGEGGRAVTDVSLSWLVWLRKALPELVIENCSSGGSRIEPYRMNMVSMCSFSDAHECAEIPLVAANVSRVIPARQSQIWAVIREGESDSRTIYSLCAAMMGRICLSGDVLNMTAEKKNLVKEGLDFYNKVKDVVRHGDIECISNSVDYYRDPHGRQIYIKKFGDKKLVIVHSLEYSGEAKIACAGYTLKGVYTDLPYTMSETELSISLSPFRAGAFLLEK